MKISADIERWLFEGDRPATVQKTKEGLSQLYREILQLNELHRSAKALHLDSSLPPLHQILEDK